MKKQTALKKYKRRIKENEKLKWMGQTLHSLVNKYTETEEEKNDDPMDE